MLAPPDEKVEFCRALPSTLTSKMKSELDPIWMFENAGVSAPAGSGKTQVPVGVPPAAPVLVLYLLLRLRAPTTAPPAPGFT